MTRTKVHNHQTVKKKIRDFYRETELWWPEEKKPERRFFKFECIDDEGFTYHKLVQDNLTNVDKLRDALIREAPLNAYWSVSSWLNPSITRGKTYKKNGDGRMDIDKNGFLYTDIVIDCDHLNHSAVQDIVDYLAEEWKIDRENMYGVFSGGGWHINIDTWYRNREVSHPIVREQHAETWMQRLALDLRDKGFNFDYFPNFNDDGEVYKLNSPTTDTRRVRKLPGTITRYGNKCETVKFSEMSDYTPYKVMDIVTSQVNGEKSLDDEIREVEAIRG